MEALKIIALVVVALIAVLLIAASTKPKIFRVQRSQFITATPDKIADLISNFHNWSQWSPYERIDPNMKRTYEGPQSGVGAVYEWAGNSKAGAGRMEITKSTPSKIMIKLDFTKPFPCHNIAEFSMESQGDSTRVTWAMYGPSNFMSKLMGTVINMDTMVGKDFQIGLDSMKSLCEIQAPSAATTPV